jgi:putative ABC transport system permease protein
MAFKDYFIVAFRNCKKHRGSCLINLTGLALGIGVCIYILQYVSYEKSFDDFHLNGNNIYRIQYNFYKNGEKKIESASAVPAVGPAMENNFPEVSDFTRIFYKPGIVSYGNSNFREEKTYAVTPSFFNLFSFPLINGDPLKSLSGPFKAVITESAAQKYFGDDDPVGKTIQWDGEHEDNLNFEITGICKDVPDNSHLKFSVLLSYQTFIDIREEGDKILENDWHWYDFYTYVLLKPESDPVDFQEKFNTWLEAELKEVWKQHNIKEEFILQPIEKIHLHSHLSGELNPNEQGNSQTISILILIAVFILLIAWVNNINLSTSQAISRSKDVTIRKVSGAFRRQLIFQFIFEFIAMNIIALFMALLIIILSLPVLNQIANKDVTIDLLFKTNFWLIFGGLFLIGSFLSSLYPAFILSSFKSSTVLKGNLFEAPSGMYLRKYIVIFQFIISIILVTVVLIVNNQLSFMQSRDLKIDIGEKLVINGPTKLISDSAYISQKNGFKNELLSQPQIYSCSSGTQIPGLEISSKQGVRKKKILRMIFTELI